MTDMSRDDRRSSIVEAAVRIILRGGFTTDLPAAEIARRRAAYCLGVDVLKCLGLSGHAESERRMQFEACMESLLGLPR